MAKGIFRWPRWPLVRRSTLDAHLELIGINSSAAARALEGINYEKNQAETALAACMKDLAVKLRYIAELESKYDIQVAAKLTAEVSRDSFKKQWTVAAQSVDKWRQAAGEMETKRDDWQKQAQVVADKLRVSEEAIKAAESDHAIWRQAAEIRVGDQQARILILQGDNKKLEEVAMLARQKLLEVAELLRTGELVASATEG